MAGQPRVLFCTGVFPPAIGGPGKIVEQLAGALSGNGYECRVLTFGRDDGASQPYDVNRIPLAIPQPLRLMMTLFKTLWLGRRADIIYSLDTYSSGFAAAIASQILRKPLIQRFSGDSAWESAFNAGETDDDIATFQNRPHGVRTKLLMWRRNFVLKTARTIITDSEFLKNFLQTIGIDASKVIVIRNPVEAQSSFDFDREAFKQEHGFKQNVILTMARLVPWKGISALIESMPDILASHPDTTLVIAGVGPSEQELKKLVNDQKIGNSVLFLGNVTDRQEKQKLYAATDVFVLNTFYESMSNVLLEAMAAGRAIVTTRAGGNPEFVNDENGMLVRYNDNVQMTSAIANLLDDAALRQKLGQQARQTVQQFTVENFVNENTKILTGVQGV
ncbi:MAG: glycosyltransferase family 4 protein [Parcubacteria group bacterium]|nr:glycosyltransferase family 4 protein [Parcubacteria group bacterium]